MDIKSDEATYNITQACNAVAARTGVSNIKVVFNMQMCDGSIVEFNDECGATVAQARLRYQNYLNVDEKSGEISVQAKLANLSFDRPSVQVAVK